MGQGRDRFEAEDRDRRPVIEPAFHTRKCPRCGTGGECRFRLRAAPAYGWAGGVLRRRPSGAPLSGTARGGVAARVRTRGPVDLHDRGGARLCRSDRLPCAASIRHQGPARQTGRCQARRGLRPADRDRRAGRAGPRRPRLPVPLRLRQHRRGAGHRAACGKDALVRLSAGGAAGTAARRAPRRALRPAGRVARGGPSDLQAARGRTSVSASAVGRRQCVAPTSSAGQTRSCGCLLQDYRRRGGRRVAEAGGSERRPAVG